MSINTHQSKPIQKNKFTVFIGGIPPEASEEQISKEISNSFKFNGNWDLVLKGKRGKKGHLGFGFIYCEDEGDKDKLIRQNSLSVFSKKLECKPAWSIEEHKKKTHSDRLRKLYISCLKKTTKQCKTHIPFKKSFNIFPLKISIEIFL